MIKVVFTYRTTKKDLPELMEKFAESGRNPKFHSEVTNQKIETHYGLHQTSNIRNSASTYLMYCSRRIYSFRRRFPCSQEFGIFFIIKIVYTSIGK